jgi:predicted phage tail protein
VGLFGKAKTLKDWNVLGYRLSKLKSAVEKEAEMGGYDPKITAKKAVKGLGEGALAVVAGALVAYFTDPVALTAVLKGAGVSEAIVALAVPLIVSGIRAAANYRKHA